MFIIFLIIGVAALISFALLRAAPSSEATAAPPASLRSRMLATAMDFTRADTLLLAPLIVYTGLSQTYFYGSIPPRLAAGLGKQYIGYGLAAFALFDTIGALATGRAAPYTGRLPLAVIALGVVSAALSLQSVGHAWIWFLVLALLGLSDGIFQTLLAAFLGKLRPGPAAPAAFGCMQ